MRALAFVSLSLICGLLVCSTSPSRAGHAQRLGPGAPMAKILRLEDRREAAPLVAFLTAEDPSVRARAALAAGRIGEASLVPPLAGLLSRDPDALVRANAAFGLGEIEDSTAAESLASILHAKRDPDSDVRARIVEGLGKLQFDRYASLCTHALSDTSSRVREAACLAVWQLHAVDAWSPLLKMATDAASPADLRWKSAYALMRMVGAPSSGKTPIPGGTDLPGEAREKIRDAFSFLSRDRDPRVRMVAVRGLAAFNDSSSVMTARASLGDADWRVRVEAMRTRSLSAEDLSPLLGDPNPNVRLSALEALGGAGRPEEARRLLRAYAPRGPREREVASISLSARLKENPAALDSLAASLASSPEWQLRAAASTVILAASGAPDSAGAAILARIATDEPRVAKSAVGPILQSRAAKAKPDEKLAATRADLDRFLDSKDPVLRSIALDSEATLLGDSMPEAEEGEWLAILRRAWDSSRNDSTSNDVPSSIVSILEKEKGRAAAAEILRDAASNRDYIVRREACRILGTGHPEPIETGRSISDYESISGWADADREIGIRSRGGQIRIRLFSRDAPLTCWNFVQLAEKGFFDHGSWHRIVPDFVVQDGCPRGDGYGGPGYTIRCEINEHPYGVGSVGMALSGKDTGGSQFFVTQSPQPHLDGRYTVFGEVVEGMDLIDRLVQYDGIETIRLLGK